MKYKLIKDRFYRKKYYKNELFQLIIKFLKFYCLLNSQLNTNFFYKYVFYKKKFDNYIFSSKTKIKNRCFITNNSRSVLRSFNVSRNYLRLLLQFGFLPGYKKVSW